MFHDSAIDDHDIILDKKENDIYLEHPYRMIDTKYQSFHREFPSKYHHPSQQKSAVKRIEFPSFI